MKRETKIISGNDIKQTDEKRTWRCTFQTGEGEIVTIPFEVLFKFIANYNIEVTRYGSHYRACNIVE